MREYQTRAYDTQDANMVMKSLQNAFQDQGFTIKTPNVDIGLITASQEVSAGVPAQRSRAPWGTPRVHPT